MTTNTTLSDLAAMRSLAEEGRRAPSQAGPYLVSWGLLLALALAGHGYVMAPGADLPGYAVWAVWGGFAVAAFGMQAMISARVARMPEASAMNNRVDQAIWGGAGLVMGALSVGMILKMLATQDWTAPNAIPGIAFAVYGGAMMASSLFSKDTTQRVFALLSGAAGLGLTIFANAAWMYFAAAGAAVVVLALPGILLMARAQRSAA